MKVTKNTFLRQEEAITFKFTAPSEDFARKAWIGITHMGDNFQFKFLLHGKTSGTALLPNPGTLPLMAPWRIAMYEEPFDPKMSYSERDELQVASDIFWVDYK